MSENCSEDSLPCPVSRAIEVLQEKWVLNIVHTLLRGPRGFNELGRAVGGCNPTTLKQRLARLEAFGLVHRRTCEDGNRSVYALTEAGQALNEVIEAIHAWSLTHLTSPRHGLELEVPPLRIESLRPRPSSSGKERGSQDAPHPPAAS